MKTIIKQKRFLSLFLMLAMTLLLLLPGKVFAESPKQIKEITIKNVVEPGPGKKISLELIDINPKDGVVLDDIRWIDRSSNYAATPYTEFKEGHEYALIVELYADSGYTFFNGSTVISKATINGFPVESVKASEKDPGKIIITSKSKLVEKTGSGSTSKKEITSVDISGIAFPKAGARPNYNATLPKDANYHFADKNELKGINNDDDFLEADKNVDGIWWYKTPSKLMLPSETFKADNDYRVLVALVPNDGYKFNISSPSKTSINGESNGSNNAILHASKTGEYIVVWSREFTASNDSVFSTALKTKSIIRENPGEDKDKVAELGEDTVIGVIEEVDEGGVNWYKILYGTKTAYIKAEDTYGLPSSSTVQVSSLNVREDADQLTRRVGGFVKGQEVNLLELIDTDGDPSTFEWAKIIYNNRVAYVISSALGSFGVGEGAGYSIVSGDNQTYSGSGDITVKADGDISFFDHLEMDDVTVNPSDYTLVSGSTEITLKESYLNKLTPGQHMMKFVYTDGYVVASLDVADASGNVPATKPSNSAGISASSNNKGEANANQQTQGKILKSTGASGQKMSPKTGDSSNVLFWIMLSLISVSGIAITYIIIKKRAFSK